MGVVKWSFNPHQGLERLSPGGQRPGRQRRESPGRALGTGGLEFSKAETLLSCPGGEEQRGSPASSTHSRLHPRPPPPTRWQLGRSLRGGAASPAGLLPRRPGLYPRNSRPLAASLASGFRGIATQENTRRRSGTGGHHRGRPSVHGHIGPSEAQSQSRGLRGQSLLSHRPRSGYLGGSWLSLIVWDQG